MRLLLSAALLGVPNGCSSAASQSAAANTADAPASDLSAEQDPLASASTVGPADGDQAEVDPPDEQSPSDADVADPFPHLPVRKQAHFDGKSEAGGLFFADGVNLRLSGFGTLGDPNGCGAFQLEVETTDFDDRVEISLWFREPLEPVAARECAAVQHFFTFDHPMDTELDGRPVFLAGTTQEVPVSDVADLRIPGGSTSIDTRSGGLSRRQVGPVAIDVMSAHSRGFDRLDALRGNTDHVELELELGVPAILIERPVGEQRLSFVVDNWFYDLLAEPGVETDELLAFARGLQAGSPTPPAPSYAEVAPPVEATEDLKRGPTVFPDGFEKRDSRTYGLVHVMISPIEPGQGFVRMDADPASERVDVLGEGDGVLQPIEEKDWLRLGFEEHGWFYDLTAQPEVSREDLLTFARGFEIGATG